MNALKSKLLNMWRFTNDSVISVEHLSLLITSYTRVLDLSVIPNIGYADFCHVMHLASTRCPVKFHFILA